MAAQIQEGIKAAQTDLIKEKTKEEEEEVTHSLTITSHLLFTHHSHQSPTIHSITVTSHLLFTQSQSPVTYYSLAHSQSPTIHSITVTSHLLFT